MSYLNATQFYSCLYKKDQILLVLSIVYNKTTLEAELQFYDSINQERILLAFIKYSCIDACKSNLKVIKLGSKKDFRISIFGT